jgi:hypothetical protein
MLRTAFLRLCRGTLPQAPLLRRRLAARAGAAPDGQLQSAGVLGRRLDELGTRAHAMQKVLRRQQRRRGAAAPDAHARRRSWTCR